MSSKARHDERMPKPERSEERFHQVREPVGNLICILWVTHARPGARAMLESWLASIPQRVYQ